MTAEARKSLGYHSVHLPPERAREVQRYEGYGSTAFVHDLLSGPLPADYDTCDVLYAEPPWRTGMARYDELAGVSDGRTYRDLMGAIADIVKAQNRPVVLVAGKHAMPYLPLPVQAHPVRLPVLGGQSAHALVYNAAFLRPMWETTADLLASLARSYRRVGDFCCGYGWAPRAFIQAGGSFVASDYNARCIGYIAAHAKKWRES